MNFKLITFAFISWNCFVNIPIFQQIVFYKHLQNNKLCFSNKVANQVDARFERHPFSSETHPAMRGSVIRDDRQLGITGEHTHSLRARWIHRIAHTCDRSLQAGWRGWHIWSGSLFFFFFCSRFGFYFPKNGGCVDLERYSMLTWLGWLKYLFYKFCFYSSFTVSRRV